MPSLFAVLLKLKAENETVISPTQGHHAHALFLSMIQEANPKLASALHGTDTAKPFTISPMQGKFGRVSKALRINACMSYVIRLTFLESDLFAYFMDASLKLLDHPLKLETATFHLEQIITTSRESALCGHHSYSDLLEEAQPAQAISLSFLSPTVFRSGGKRNVLFPEASLVFGSFLNKWRQFYKLGIDDLLQDCFNKILISKYHLSTRILHFNNYQEIGFEGNCIYELPRGLSIEQLKALNALSDFSFYCGTGAKTTMGMGQTRRIK